MVKTALTALLMLLVSGVAYADEGKDKAPSELPAGTVLVPKKEISFRPNAPSRVTIECRYGDGLLWLQLPAGVYYANLRLSNDTYVWEGLVTAEAPMVEIPSLTGEYTLLCQTDDGRLFTGVLEF